jgi:hypothetical protein
VLGWVLRRDGDHREIKMTADHLGDVGHRTPWSATA